MFLTGINSALYVYVCCSICKNPHKSGQIMLISKEFLPCVNFVLLVHQEASVSQIHFCRPQPLLLVYQLKIPDLRCTLNINSLQYWKRNVNCSNGIVRAVRTHYCRMLLRSKAHCMLCPTREVEEKLCDTKYLYLKDSWKYGTSNTSSSKQTDRFTFQIVSSQMHSFSTWEGSHFLPPCNTLYSSHTGIVAYLLCRCL